MIPVTGRTTSIEKNSTLPTTEGWFVALDSWGWVSAGRTTTSVRYAVKATGQINRTQGNRRLTSTGAA